MNKILIDLATIKKNPDYAPGCRRYMPSTGTVSFVCRGGIPSLLTNENTRFTSEDSGIIFDLHSIDSNALAKELIDKGIQMELNYERETIEITTISESEYDFEYVPTMVKCYACKAEFLHTELETDDYFDGTDDHYTSEACPNCGAWDCLDGEWEWETVEEAVLRKTKAEAPTVEEFKQQVQQVQNIERKIISELFGESYDH